MHDYVYLILPLKRLVVPTRSVVSIFPSTHVCSLIPFTGMNIQSNYTGSSEPFSSKSATSSVSCWGISFLRYMWSRRNVPPKWIVVIHHGTAIMLSATSLSAPPHYGCSRVSASCTSSVSGGAGLYLLAGFTRRAMGTCARGLSSRFAGPRKHGGTRSANRRTSLSGRTTVSASSAHIGFSSTASLDVNARLCRVGSSSVPTLQHQCSVGWVAAQRPVEAGKARCRPSLPFPSVF